MLEERKKRKKAKLANCIWGFKREKKAMLEEASRCSAYLHTRRMCVSSHVLRNTQYVLTTLSS